MTLEVAMRPPPVRLVARLVVHEVSFYLRVPFFTDCQLLPYHIGSVLTREVRSQRMVSAAPVQGVSLRKLVEMMVITRNPREHQCTDPSSELGWPHTNGGGFSLIYVWDLLRSRREF